MNGLKVLYHVVKLNITNALSNIKGIFKRKPKLSDKPCFIKEVHIMNFEVINLLREIKIVDYNAKTMKSYDAIPTIFRDYPGIKTVFTSTLVQNCILNLKDQYKDHLIYIEEVDKEKLLIKVHLLSIKLFKELFVIPDHRADFDQRVTENTINLRLTLKDGDNYILNTQDFINNQIQPTNVIRTLSSFKSILDIVGNEQDVNFYLLNETFINKIVSELPESNDKILEVILSNKPITDFIIINKIL